MKFIPPDVMLEWSGGIEGESELIPVYLDDTNSCWGAICHQLRGRGFVMHSIVEGA